MSIGKNIKQLRQQMGLTQKQFAQKIGILDKQLCRYEVGGSTPSINLLKKIADFCEVSLDQVVYGKDMRLSNKTKIRDQELLRFFQQLDKLNKIKRQHFKWILSSLISNVDSSD